MSARRRPKSTRDECGQALVETAAVTFILVVFALGLLALIPAHRARSVATAAAYACAQFVTQAPGDPGRAAWMGEQVARQTLEGDWSESAGVRYSVYVMPAGPGAPGACTVTYLVPSWFGFGGPSVQAVTAVGRGERWKARWK